MVVYDVYLLLEYMLASLVYKETNVSYLLNRLSNKLIIKSRNLYI